MEVPNISLYSLILIHKKTTNILEHIPGKVFFESLRPLIHFCLHWRTAAIGRDSRNASGTSVRIRMTKPVFKKNMRYYGIPLYLGPTANAVQDEPQFCFEQFLANPSSLLYSHWNGPNSVATMSEINNNDYNNSLQVW